MDNNIPPVGSQMLLFEAPNEYPPRHQIDPTAGNLGILTSLRTRLVQDINQTTDKHDLSALTSNLVKVITLAMSAETEVAPKEVSKLSVYQGRRHERQSRASGQD